MKESSAMNIKSLVVCFSLLLYSLTSFSQSKFMGGGRVGLGVSTLPGLDQGSGVFHFAFGGVVNYNILPFLGIGADVLFLTTGANYDGSSLVEDPQGFVNSEPYSGELRFTSLSIPLYPQLSFGNEDFRVLVNGGLATNFNLFASESRDYANDENNENLDDLIKDIISDYQAVSFAIFYGVGTRFKLSEDEFLQVDLRYTTGLNDIHTTRDNENPSTFTRDLYSVNVSYFF